MRRVVLAGLALCMAAGAAAAAQDRPSPVQGPVAWWPLDTVEGETSPDRVGGHRDRIEGLYRVALGVVGQAIVFDGDTTVLRRAAAAAPVVSSAFTVEAWLALGAYPWNVVPVVDHGDEQMRLDGRAISRGPRFRYGHRHTLAGTDLVVWIETRSDASLRIRLDPGEGRDR